MDTSKAKSAQGRKKPSYTGGLVLEPKKGTQSLYNQHCINILTHNLRVERKTVHC